MNSSHQETTHFRFSEFLNTDLIIDFNEETNYLIVNVKNFENDENLFFFDIDLSLFVDKKRKECEVNFNTDSNESVSNEFPFLYYEGQLIENELDYFLELQEMNQEDKKDAQSDKNDLFEIKIKLLSLFLNSSYNISIENDSKRNINNSHLTKEERILLCQINKKHFNFRNSYVNFAKKVKMQPIEKKSDTKDNYIIFDLVEEGIIKKIRKRY